MAPPNGDVPDQPSSPKQRTTEETLMLQVQEFLDGWEFRIMRSSLGKKWKREKAVITALELMAVNGVPLSKDDIAKMSQLEESSVVQLLTEKMPPTMWDNFEILATELMVMLNTMCRVRTAIDDEQDIESLVEETAESDTMVQRVLKESVIEASKEAASLSQRGASWRASTEKRLESLESSARYAEHARQQLVAVEQQLDTFTQDQKGKNKSALLGIAQGNDKALMKTLFSGWLGHTMATKAERDIRAKYEAELGDAEQRLFAYTEKRLAGVKDALMRKVREGDRGLVDLCISSWYDVVQQVKKDGDTKAEMEKMAEKMKEFKGEAKERQMKVMQRLMAEGDQAAILLAWTTWQSFHEDYLKDKESEEAAKKLELQLAEQMKAKKEDAKKVLDRMGGATNTGLLQQVWRSWMTAVVETKKSKKLTKAMEEQDVRLKLMLSSQKDNACTVQKKTNEQMNDNLLTRVMGVWMLETKVNHVEKHYRQKIDTKRDQLRKVQTLFKRFANELEEGLNMDGDSSGRTQTRRSKSKVEALPEIHHARP